MSRLSLSTIDHRALMLVLGTFAIGTDAFIIGGILPGIAQDLSASIGKAGLVVSVFSLSYALGSPIISELSASWRRSTRNNRWPSRILGRKSIVGPVTNAGLPLGNTCYCRDRGRACRPGLLCACLNARFNSQSR
jgi:MFS family permease